jgi:hypothetical protein
LRQPNANSDRHCYTDFYTDTNATRHTYPKKYA